MKSMERAKSFVASRPAANKLSKASTTLETIASFPQRSNSVCGPHAASQNAKMASIVEEVMLLNDPKGLANLAPSASCKSRVKAKTKVLVQLQSMQVKVAAIDTMLHSLQDLSDRCQRERIKVPRMRNCSKDEANCCEHDAIIKLVVEIEQSVKIVRNSLLFLCRTFLLEKQITVLLSIQEQMYPTLDISVRFFGIDWIHIFRVSYHLKQCVDLMIDTLVNETSTAFTDVLLPSNILRGLATIEADVSSHAEAVLHGRLSKIAQEKINLAAEQHQQQLLQEITADNVLGGGCSASTDMVNEAPDANGDIEVKGGRHHFVGDLRRKLRKAIRLPTSVSMHGLSYFGRHSRSTEAGSGLIDKRAKSHHDALWRAWYTGLQTITIPAAAFSMSALNQVQRSEPIAETATSSAASSPSSISRYLPSSSGTSEQPISAVYASSSEAGGQLRLLGDVVHHSHDCDEVAEEDSEYVASSASFDAIDMDANSISLDPATSSHNSSEEFIASEAADETEAGNSITDDSFDSLTLTLNMVCTPRQGVAESQL